MMKTATMLVVCGVLFVGVGLCSFSQDAAGPSLGMILTQSQMGQVDGGCCSKIGHESKTLCSTGEDTESCSGDFPSCGGTCSTDCSAVSGDISGGDTESYGYFSEKTCGGDGGSTYDKLNCTAGSSECQCDGAVVSSGWSCDGSYSVFENC